MYSQLTSDVRDEAPERSNSRYLLKVGVALGIASCLLLATYGAGAADATSLVGVMPAATRFRSTRASPMMPKGLTSLPGPSPWKELALAGLEAANSCDRDVSAQAHSNLKLKAVLDNMNSENKAIVRSAVVAAASKVQDMPGVIAPTGLFDPMGFSTDLTEGRLAFLREVELKHGRICMLASLGWVVGEKFHPLFGDIDESAVAQLSDASLAGFWYALAFAVALPEVASLKYFPAPEDGTYNILKAFTDKFEMKTDRIPGDLGYDPLGFKPKDAKGLLEMQNKELSNGRLAMIGVAGMFAQEAIYGEKIFN